MKMTKRGFEYIAGIIASINNDTERDTIAQRVADELGNANPLFKRKVFIAACQPSLGETKYLKPLSQEQQKLLDDYKARQSYELDVM